MINYSLPLHPTDEQLVKLKEQLKKQLEDFDLKTFKKLLLLSFDLFQELKKLNPEHLLLIQWRWAVTDLL